ncbi:MAG: PEP-utilizing enzyme [Dehalococcoidia bacterium]
MTTSPAVDAEVLAAWRLPYPTTPYDIWTRTNVGEVFPNVVTPLTWSIYYGVLGARLLQDEKRLAMVPPELFQDGLPPLLFTTIGGRLWYNAGMTYHIATERFGLPSSFYSLSLGGPREGELLHLAERNLRPLQLIRSAPGLLREQRRVQEVVEQFERDAPAMRAEARRLRDENLTGLDRPALVARLDRVADSAFALYMQLLDGSAAALNAYGTLTWLCDRWCNDRSLANDLVTGLANLLTAQASVGLWNVARMAAANPAARQIIESVPPADVPARLHADPNAAAVAAALDHFFRDYGHRAADEFELSVPRWSEDPTFIISTLRAYLNAPLEMDPTHHLRRQRAHRHAAEERARRRLLAKPVDKVAPWRWAVFRSVVRQARRYLPMRENPKHHFLLFAAELRRTALALGQDLQRAGLIDASEDVFFLMRPDLERAAGGDEAGLHARAAAQRRVYQRFLAWDPPDVILGSEREGLEERLVNEAVREPAPKPKPDGATAPAAGRLTGIAASAGTVTARVRVALTPEEGAEIEPGEVLVAPFTDPGWTPLFTVAGAIVMDLGGLLSHGAIVAREYGIPAVVNTRSATSTLRTGQVVTVDGASGVVTWEEQPVIAAG